MVYVKKSNSKNKTISPNRICDRCGKRYAVDEQGVALQQETCMFHWGRMFRDSYSCCNRNEYATGCSEAKGHVWEYIDYGNLYGYVETLPKGKSSQVFSDFALFLHSNICILRSFSFSEGKC